MFRNLSACHELIDRTKPEQSKLLKYLVTPHGGLKKPAYRIGSKHFEAIRQWVLTAGDAKGGDQSFNGSHTANQTPPPEVVPAGLWRDVTDSGDRTKRTQTGVDPFDPEVFNRKYGVDRADEAADAESELAFPIPGTIPDRPETDESIAIPRRLSEQQTSGATPVEKK